MINNLQEAQMTIGTAMQIIDRHDGVLGKLMGLRAEYELALVLNDSEFDVPQAMSVLARVGDEAKRYADRVITLCDVDTFEDFRMATSQAQFELGLVDSFRTELAEEEFFLEVYTKSGLPPQRLPDGQQYVPSEVEQRIANLRIQQQSAVERLFATTRRIELNAPSGIFPAGGLITPGN